MRSKAQGRQRGIKQSGLIGYGRLKRGVEWQGTKTIKGEGERVRR